MFEMLFMINDVPFPSPLSTQPLCRQEWLISEELEASWWVNPFDLLNIEQVVNIVKKRKAKLTRGLRWWICLTLIHRLKQ
jgi:hypothetical protein